MDADSSQEPFRLTADDPLAGLSLWLGDERVDAAAAARARQRWLERQAAEEATLAGVLIDLAERGGPVTLRSRAGRTTRGRVVALGADFVVIREDRLGDVLIPLATLATVRPAPGDKTTAGDRPPALAVALAEALVEIATERPLVLVSTAGEEIRGELRSAGTDVVAVAIESAHRDVVHIAMGSIDHLVLLAN